MKQVPKVNYDRIMQQAIQDIKKGNKKPTLLLHSCCAPCSSYVLKLLQSVFDITVFFYNSNLYPDKEYQKREQEQKRLIKILNQECQQKKENGDFDGLIFYETEIKIESTSYHPREFYDFVKGYEKEFEGSSRCYMCYMLRMSKAAQLAKELNFDYFTTTLSVSPYKNAQWINEVGAILQQKYGVPFLHSDFKKNDGYKKSIEYSQQYKLYRQDYCGCEFSLKQKIACLPKAKNEG